MKLEQLRSFREAAIQGSFSKAARSLFLTQSAISMQIGALEKELGTRLFDRRGRQTSLTDVGRVLLVYANQISELVDESQRATGQMRDDGVSGISIGASRLIGHYVLPDIIRRLRKEYPSVQITLEVTTPLQVASQVAAGTVDVGLVDRPIADVGIVQRAFHTDELVVVVPPDHRWARRDALDPRELETEPFVARERDSYTRALTEAALAPLGIVLQPSMELRSPEGIKSAVRSGLGISIISKAAIGLELQARVLQTVPLRGMKIERPFLAIRAAGANGSSGSRAVGFLLSMLEGPESPKC